MAHCFGNDLPSLFVSWIHIYILNVKKKSLLLHFIFAISHLIESAMENVTIYFAPYPADNTNSIHFIYTKATCKIYSIPSLKENYFDS